MQMTYSSIRNMSYSLSLMFHLLLLLVFLLIKITVDYPPSEYVELSFGDTGNISSSGAKGSRIENIEERAAETKSQTVEKSEKEKEVELPKAKNTSTDNPVKPADESKNKSQIAKAESKEISDSKISAAGQGNKTSGEGSFGFDIDWGGKGKRKIYSYNLPDYPEGVYKEIDIRLRFTILPDGTVGTILPLIKADTKLENAAINSLRQWRFEALEPTQKQAEQTAIIVFPYRLQ